MKKKLLLISTLIITSSPALSQSNVLEEIREKKEIVIGYPAEAMPFSYNTGEAAPIGYSIDLCHRVTARIQSELQIDSLKLKFEPLDFDERLDAVESGRVHLECGSTTNTLERQEKVDFSVSTFAAMIKVVTRRNEKLDSLDALDGRALIAVNGTTMGPTAETFATENGLTFKLTPAPNLVTGFQQFVDGKADGIVFDDVVVAPLVAKATDGDYQFLEPALAIEYLGLVLPKGNADLKRVVDSALKEMMASGEALDIYKKWFQSPIKPDGLNLELAASDELLQLFRTPSDQADGQPKP